MENTVLKKIISVQDSVGNEENEYTTPDCKKPISVTKRPVTPT
jgi:hypothetical protein